MSNNVKKKNVCNNEAWKFITWIDGIPIDKYMVSSTGRVFNTYTRRFISMCIIKDNLTVGLNNGPTTRGAFRTTSASVARLVAIAFLPIPGELDFCDYADLNVFQKDGNKLNLCVENLRWDIRGSRSSGEFEYDQITDVLNQYKDTDISYTKITEILRTQHGIKRSSATICLMYNHKLPYLDKMRHQVEPKTVKAASGRSRKTMRK